MWHATLYRENHNKLRAYQLFKRESLSELNLETPIARKERKVLAQIRCGVAHLKGEN